MKWLRHRKARADRDAGLVFAWRGMNPGFGRRLSAVLVVGILGTLLAVAVRVRVVPPTPVSQRTGSVVIAVSGEASESLLGRLDEVSPFPSRFEARGLAEIERRLAGAMIAADTTGGAYRPQLRELPEEEEGNDLSALMAARGELPPLPRAGAGEVVVTPPVRLTAELVPDLADLASRVVTPVPELVVDGGSMAAGSATRFLIEVKADGGVGSVVPLDGASAAAVPGVDVWLARLRFDVSGNVSGWHAVEVHWVSGDD